MKSTVDGTPLPTPAPPPPPEKWWAELPNGQYVKYLKDDTFNEAVSAKETALVMFYAPCKYPYVFFTSFSNCFGWGGGSSKTNI